MQNGCGYESCPRKIHALIYEWPTDNGAWHQRNKAVTAPDTFDGIVLGNTY